MAITLADLKEHAKAVRVAPYQNLDGVFSRMVVMTALTLKRLDDDQAIDAMRDKIYAAQKTADFRAAVHDYLSALGFSAKFLGDKVKPSAPGVPDLAELGYDSLFSHKETLAKLRRVPYLDDYSTSGCRKSIEMLIEVCVEADNIP